MNIETKDVMIYLYVLSAKFRQNGKVY